MFALSLSQANNRVGLSLEDNSGQPNPDLYQRISADELRHVEVKAPNALQYPFDTTLNKALVFKHVKSTIDRSKSQINRANPGVVAIGTSMFGQPAQGWLTDAALSSISKVGRNRHSLCGVLCGAFDAPVWNGSFTDFGFAGMAFNIVGVGNRHCEDHANMHFDMVA
jgi:hypothetical protein